MRNEESEFSSLRTVSSFDRGELGTVAVEGNNVEIEHFSPSSLFVESLIEQLCKLMERDPNNQKKLYLTVCEQLHQMNLISESYERDEFQFMRSHYQKALYHLLTITKSTSVENKALLPKSSYPLHLSNASVLEWSRYCTEFKELDYIARGGFGHVYKVQHKLDSEYYAVKKILLRYKSVNDFMINLKEVKMLAKLNHPNIVSYKAAWLEPSDQVNTSRTNYNSQLPALLNGESSDICDEEFDEDDDEEEEDRSGGFCDYDGEVSSDIVFEESQKNSISIVEENITSLSSKTNSRNALRPEEAIICRKKVDKCTYFEERCSRQKQSAILYIQMQLCKRTLRHWLDQRNQLIIQSEIDVDQCLEIFKKIVKGVEYIHSQGIVHHDIKPSNIFVSEDLNEVQVGDFGLACCLLAHPSSSLSLIATHPRGEIGTRLYAAPEQLKGICNSKSDVYSLGIVLLELLQPFQTVMERTEVIDRLKSGHIASEIIAERPYLAKIIIDSVTVLNERPTSTELLLTLEELQKSDTVKLVAQQSELIKQLRRESRAKDEEIASLRKKLEELSSKNTEGSST